MNASESVGINASRITSRSIKKPQNQPHPTARLKRAVIKNPDHEFGVFIWTLNTKTMACPSSLAFLDLLWGVTFDLFPWPDDLTLREHKANLAGSIGAVTRLDFSPVPTWDAQNATARTTTERWDDGVWFARPGEHVSREVFAYIRMGCGCENVYVKVTCFDACAIPEDQTDDITEQRNHAIIKPDVMFVCCCLL